MTVRVTTRCPGQASCAGLLRAKLGDSFKAGIVVYSGAHTPPMADRIWALPLSEL